MFTFDENLVSDLHKDAHGFRPGESFWNSWKEMTNEEKQIKWDNLCRDLEDSIKQEENEHARSVKDFEDKIQDLLKIGASTREQAISWFLDSIELSENDKLYGAEYVCYKLGIPYSMKNEFEFYFKQGE